MLPVNQIIVGAMPEATKEWPGESINCCISSPPYWALRDYGVEGQLGLEPTFEEYIDKLCGIYDEVKRVLRKDGTCFVNLGDTYNNVTPGARDSGRWPKQSRNDHNPNKRRLASVQTKSLCLIPQRFATMMVDGKYKAKIVQNEVDRAWLAAIIDGEGCVSIRWGKEPKYSDSYEPFVYVKVCDSVLLHRIVEITKMGKVREDKRNRPKQHRMQYSWCATGQQAASLLADVYPYILVKKNQCKIVCELARRRKEGKHFQQTPKEEVAERHKLYEMIKKYNQRELEDDCELPDPPQSRIGGGWILRNVIIWHKPNPMPSSAKDRFTVDFEYVYFFVKSKKYWFEPQYEPVLESTLQRDKYTRILAQDGPQAVRHDHETPSSPLGRNKRCVWTISTQPYGEAHFATFPEKLVEPMIKAGCPEFICTKCGKAREKILEISGGTIGKDWNQNRRGIKNGEDLTKGTKTDPKISNGTYKREFKGYTDCGCNADWRPGIVWDCFCWQWHDFTGSRQIAA